MPQRVRIILGLKQDWVTVSEAVRHTGRLVLLSQSRAYNPLSQLNRRRDFSRLGILTQLRMEMPYTSTPHFIVLHFIVLHRCCLFYKMKARPTISKYIYIYICRGLESNPQYLRGIPVQPGRLSESLLSKW